MILYIMAIYLFNVNELNLMECARFDENIPWYTSHSSAPT